MTNYTWTAAFLELFDRCVDRYRSGDANWHHYYSDDDLRLLSQIGYKPRELFDFVEDLVDSGVPTREDALLIAAVRRDYLRVVQNGEHSDREMPESALPGRQADLAGFRWLPRIIQKAENKLRGENDPEIMYSCGGDRAFLSRHDIHPADFLRAVWAAEGDEQKIVEFVQAHSPIGPDA